MFSQEMAPRKLASKRSRKENSQIKCLAAVEEEIVTSGFDNKVNVLLIFLWLI